MSKQYKMTSEDVAAIGNRLRALRETTGLTQTQFAEHVGLGGTQWANFEAAHSRIGIDAALQITRVMRVPLDWIYLGETAWLPLELSRRIEHALRNPTTKRGPRKKDCQDVGAELIEPTSNYKTVDQDG